MRAEEHSLETRSFGTWQERIVQNIGPADISTPDPTNFFAKMRITELGAVQVSALSASPIRARRMPKMILRHDPELYHLGISSHSRADLTYDGISHSIQTGHFAFYDSSRPHELRIGSDEGSIAGMFVAFPHALLPLAHQRFGHRLLHFSGEEYLGSLIFNLLRDVNDNAARYSPADRVRIGTILIDLLAAQLAHMTDAGEFQTPETRQHTLQRRIHAFIQKNLANPDLTPATIATAHNISLRSLHRTFQGQGITVSEWIRVRRLDRCRRDLTDPLLMHRPIHAIAARWGFPEPAQFSRSFRALYGITPQDWRRHAIDGTGRTDLRSDAAAGPRG